MDMRAQDGQSPDAFHTYPTYIDTFHSARQDSAPLFCREFASGGEYLRVPYAGLVDSPYTSG